MKTLSLVFALIMAPLLSADEPLRGLTKIEAGLKSSPDDPMLHYRKCQALFAAGKEQEALNHAAVALTKFKLAQNDLAWMGLGSFTTKHYRIEVHFNMGPDERSERRDGIVLPYSFRIWTAGDEPKLVQILDFELAYSDGEVVSAAIGEMTSRGHANFGIVDPKSDFATIKKKVLQIIAN